MTAEPRYAVYFAPAPAHPLWRAGCDWLGRDAADPDAPVLPRVGVDDPCRYGFHATLKAPMRLAAGRHEADLCVAVQALAAEFAPFAMPELVVGSIADFVALRPREPSLADHPLRRLADACVTRLDRFRAPPDEDERRRWQPMLRDDEQRALWQRYGYPHVLHRWRFHMTLTNRLAGGVTAESDWLDRARRHFDAALAEPLYCDALCLFAEPAPGQPFVWWGRFPLQSAAQSAVAAVAA